jgi:hypothetical protein
MRSTKPTAKLKPNTRAYSQIDVSIVSDVSASLPNGRNLSPTRRNFALLAATASPASRTPSGPVRFRGAAPAAA